MDLVPISISGRPERDVPELPDTALEALAGTAMLYRETGFDPPWIGYLVVDGGQCVGTCAFKCAPVDGRVELAYFTFPGHEGRGLATRMCCELVKMARTAEPDVTIAAQTLPEHDASTRVLEKAGFRWHSELEHPEDGRVWEWRLEPGLTPPGARPGGTRP
jgi:[ribosomal protein S5]-alanine N-acetyltransferase